MALRVPEMCFWPAKTRKNLELLEMHRCHWPGSQIWFRHKWKKLVTASVLLHCIDGYSCLCYWNEFFSAMFQVLDWSFLELHFYGNVCNWIPELIWSQMDWFWVFLLEFGFFRWLHICMNWNLQHLLKFLWRHQIFSLDSLRSILICSLNVPWLFGQRIL